VDEVLAEAQAGFDAAVEANAPGVHIGDEGRKCYYEL